MSLEDSYIEKLKKKKKNAIVEIVLILIIVMFGYWGICCAIWQVRNPKANQATVYSHVGDVLTFKKLDRFQ